MKKKLIIFFILFVSSFIWAETVQKQKTFDNWTITLNEQEKTLQIIDSDGTTSVPKEYLEKKESSDEQSSESKKRSIKDLNAKKERVVVKCIQVMLIHGQIEDLELIYNSLNSASDCKNLDLQKMGFYTGVAKSISKNSKTGEITSLTDLIISNDIEWE